MTLSVAVVDDSKMSRKTVINALPEAWLNDVSEAKNGEEAIALFMNGKADVMFLDLTMPVMDGFQVLELLNSRKARNFVFVISADIQPHSQKRVMELGATRFLQKPLQKDELSSVLREVGLI